MAIHTTKNQYRGINAHLHSLLQSEGGWDSFHANHIADLTRLLQVQLRPMGYTADIEQSLQIRRIGEPARYPESDVTIYDTQPDRPQSTPRSASQEQQEAVLSIPVLLNLTDEQIADYRAIGIYQHSGDERGEPVAWLELLSPSNKPTGRDYYQYEQKRNAILEAGLVFIEVDYLHHTPPTFAGLPNYRPSGGYLRPPEPNSHPFRITVVDPRPEFLEGVGHSYGFDVDEPIPLVKIPLNGDDLLSFDFGVPYLKSYEEMFYGDRVDYSQLPAHFEVYSVSDQRRLLMRMVTVLNASEVERENPPIKISEALFTLSVDALQARLNA